MNKVLYNVTVSINPEVEKEWLAWMKETHIPDVMRTGYFLQNRICRVQDLEEEGGKTYAIQFICNSMADLMTYQNECAPALQADHNQRFQGKFAAFRTVLEIIHEHPQPNVPISAN